MSRLHSNLCICAVYFNFLSNPLIKRNFKGWYNSISSINANVVVVELTLTGHSELVNECKGAELLLVNGDENSILWQKERLMNIALNSGAIKEPYVLFSDADIIFLNQQTISSIESMLDSDYMAIQPFEVIFWETGPDDTPIIDGKKELHLYPYNGFAHVYKIRKKIRSDDSINTHGHPGFAWAFRTQEILKCQFFEKAILGGGDNLLAFGITTPPLQLNKPNYLRNHFPKSIWREFLTWNEKAYSVFMGNIGACPGAAIHLWHGDIKTRKYGERYRFFKTASFDIGAANDFSDQSGPILWKKSAFEFRNYAKKYFHERCITL